MAGEKAGQGKRKKEGTARSCAIPGKGRKKLKSRQYDRTILTAQSHSKTSGLPAPVRIGDAVRGQAAVKCHADRQRPFRAEYGESVHLLPGKRQIPVPVLHGAHPQEPEILHGFGSGKGYPDPGFRGVGYERVIPAVTGGDALGTRGLHRHAVLRGRGGLESGKGNKTEAGHARGKGLFLPLKSLPVSWLPLWRDPVPLTHYGNSRSPWRTHSLHG